MIAENTGNSFGPLQGKGLVELIRAKTTGESRYNQGSAMADSAMFDAGKDDVGFPGD